MDQPEHSSRSARVRSDAILDRLVVWSLLAAFIAATYLTIAVGGSVLLRTRDRPSTALSVLAVTIAAIAFGRVRVMVERIAARVRHGERATPYEVLSELSRRVARTHSASDVLPRLARIVAEGTGATRAEVWLSVGGELRTVAGWPASGKPASPSATDRVVEVRDRGELLGVLAVYKADVITPTEEALLADVAGQAGMLLRNASLTAELRARVAELGAAAGELHRSRERIVVAHDAERRRLERDIHDGAQQHLVALATNIGLARTLTTRDPARAVQALAAVNAITGEALETLRSLVHQGAPGLLGDHGLAAAIGALVKLTGTRVQLDVGDLGRYADEVEGAVYFSCVEALQNCAKHARASRVTVTLRALGEELSFEVQDDGCGFDPAGSQRGAGLSNIRDRLAVLGGTLEIESAHRATTVRGRVPATAIEMPG